MKKLMVVGDNNAEILDSIESEYEVVTLVTAKDAVYFVTSQDTNIRQEFLNQITDMKECDAFSKEGTKAYKMMKEYLNYANGAESAISLIDHICYSYSHGTKF